MARLTNSIRQEIVASIIKKTFRVRGVDLERAETLLAFRLRDSFLGKHRDIYLALPGRLQETSNNVMVELNRNGKNYDRHNYSFHPSMRLTPHYVQQNAYYNSDVLMCGTKAEPDGNITVILRSDLGKKLADDVVAYADKFNKFENDVKELTNKVSEQLKACTTTEKLVAQWPEIGDHIPPAMNPLTVQIDREKTNKLIVCMEAGTCK